MKKVVDVSMQVTCLEQDVETVRAELTQWFRESETPLVIRPRTGGVNTNTPRTIRPWMKETLCLKGEVT